jgi:hypothetical protein
MHILNKDNEKYNLWHTSLHKHTTRVHIAAVWIKTHIITPFLPLLWSACTPHLSLACYVHPASSFPNWACLGLETALTRMWQTTHFFQLGPQILSVSPIVSFPTMETFHLLPTSKKPFHRSRWTQKSTNHRRFTPHHMHDKIECNHSMRREASPIQSIHLISRSLLWFR